LVYLPPQLQEQSPVIGRAPPLRSEDDFSIDHLTGLDFAEVAAFLFACGSFDDFFI
jgi:hypothetical protein